MNTRTRSSSRNGFRYDYFLIRYVLSYQERKIAPIVTAFFISFLQGAAYEKCMQTFFNKVETESTEEEVVLEEKPTEQEIPVEKEESVTEPVPQENTELVVIVPEQSVEEEILPTPVEKAESSIRPVILVFTGITALVAIAVILVLVLPKRR